MSKLIADINGRKVYSDKRMSSIINTRVTFTDGSWCDVATSEIVNRGPGHINIGAPLDDSDNNITFGPKHFRTTALDICEIDADVEIQPTEDVHMTISIKGVKSAVDDIEVYQNGDALIVESKNTGGTSIHGANVIINRSGSSMSISGRGISIGGGNITSNATTVINCHDNENATKVVISVPKGTAISIAGVQGKVDIGNIEGQLNASISGGDKIKVGNICDAILSVNGSGSITVASAKGALSMNVQGSGKVNVQKGAVRILSANITGSGKVHFGGQATNANLSVIGNGGMDIFRVENRPIKNITGNGNITIRN